MLIIQEKWSKANQHHSERMDRQIQREMLNLQARIQKNREEPHLIVHRSLR